MAKYKLEYIFIDENDFWAKVDSTIAEPNPNYKDYYMLDAAKRAIVHPNPVTQRAYYMDIKPGLVEEGTKVVLPLPVGSTNTVYYISDIFPEQQDIYGNEFIVYTVTTMGSAMLLYYGYLAKYSNWNPYNYQFTMPNRDATIYALVNDTYTQGGYGIRLLFVDTDNLTLNGNFDDYKAYGTPINNQFNGQHIADIYEYDVQYLSFMSPSQLEMAATKQGDTFLGWMDAVTGAAIPNLYDYLLTYPYYYLILNPIWASQNSANNHLGCTHSQMSLAHNIII